MKVMHISTVHLAFDQRIFHRECISLSKAGYDVTLLARYDENDTGHEGVNIVQIGSSIKKIRSFSYTSKLAYSFSFKFTHLYLKK